jgi:hypothetical protein
VFSASSSLVAAGGDSFLFVFDIGFVLVFAAHDMPELMVCGFTVLHNAKPGVQYNNKPAFFIVVAESTNLHW